MEKLRGILEQHGRWGKLQDYVARIETYIDTDFSLAIENAKSLLESIAKEICHQQQVVLGKDPDFREVLKRAFSILGLEDKKDPEPTFARSILSATQKIAEVRNQIGTTSHGKTLQELEECNSKIHHLTREFFIDAVEMVAAFFIRRFEAEFPLSSDSSVSNKAIEYNDHPAFNESWDESFGEFSMGDYAYAASEILFAVDPQAYTTEANAFHRGAKE